MQELSGMKIPYCKYADQTWLWLRTVITIIMRRRQGDSIWTGYAWDDIASNGNQSCLHNIHGLWNKTHCLKPRLIFCRYCHFLGLCSRNHRHSVPVHAGHYWSRRFDIRTAHFGEDYCLEIGSDHQELYPSLLTHQVLINNLADTRHIVEQITYLLEL